MIRNHIGVSAALMPAMGSAGRAISGSCRRVVAAMYGFAQITSKWARRDAQRRSAQAECMGQIEALHRRRLDLLVEKEIVAAERKEAIRRHRRAASFDARLRAITRELLSIG